MAKLISSSLPRTSSSRSTCAYPCAPTRSACRDQHGQADGQRHHQKVVHGGDAELPPRDREHVHVAQCCPGIRLPPSGDSPEGAGRWSRSGPCAAIQWHQLKLNWSEPAVGRSVSRSANRVHGRTGLLAASSARPTSESTMTPPERGQGRDGSVPARRLLVHLATSQLSVYGFRVFRNRTRPRGR
jgi:hypothetical protein